LPYIAELPLICLLSMAKDNDAALFTQLLVLDEAWRLVKLPFLESECERVLDQQRTQIRRTFLL